MAAAQVGDGLVQREGHCCHPAALATGDHTVPGGKLQLQLPIPPCLPLDLALLVSGVKAGHFHA